MTWLLVSVSCNILRIIWDKQQQTFFPSNNILLMSDNHAIPAILHCNLFLLTNQQHLTDWLQIARRWKTPATCSHTQEDSSWVNRTCWLLLIPFWHIANYIVLRVSHFLLFSSSSPIPHQHIRNTQPPLPGQSGSNAGRLVDGTWNTGILGT